MSPNVTRNVLFGVIAVLLVAVGFLGRAVDDRRTGRGTVSVPADVPAATTTLDYQLIGEILSILDEDFVEQDRVDYEYLFEGAIQGVFDALGDPHSTYIDPDTWAISRSDFSGTFQGIGANVAKPDEYIVIVRPLPGTPADAAGILAGDIILEVDGQDAQGWALDKAVLRIRGPRGTDVALLVRHTDGSEELITITRGEIVIASVSPIPPGGVLQDAEGEEATDIGYFRIRQFTQLTPSELSDQINEAIDRGVHGLIIDVRSNPGGLLVETTEIVDMFLDEGIILIQVNRSGREDRIEARQGQLTTLPIVVVQDEFSASGSELFAAALQENGRAQVVGTRSFGKGTVNHARDLSNGGAVYVSIARWLTPARNQIEGLGVTPDIEIVLTAEDIEEGRDVAIYRAIDLLRAEQG